MRSPNLDLQDIESRIDRMPLGAGANQVAAGPPVPLDFARLLVGIDGSPQSEHALAWAATLARAFGSEVDLLTVIGPPGFDSGLGAHGIPASTTAATYQRLIADQKQAAADILAAAQRGLAAAGIQATTQSTVGTPAKRIAQIASERSADLILMGSHGPGLAERLLLGSVADGVKQAAEASVLITKGPPPAKNVLLPSDGSCTGRAAALSGIRIAAALEGNATILHVVDLAQGGYVLAHDAYEKAVRERAESDADEAHITLPAGVRVEVAFGDAADEIVRRTQDRRADLIVMGCRGLSGLRSTVAGGVSNPVTHRATCSVLLYKEPPA